MELVQHEDFFKQSNLFFLIIGVQPYVGIVKGSAAFYNIIKPIILGNAVLTVFSLGTKLILLNFNNISENLTAMINFLFATISLVEVFSVMHNKTKITKLMQYLKTHFPQTLEQQQQCQLHKQFKIFRLITGTYVYVTVMLFCVFNFFQLSIDLIYLPLFKSGQFSQHLPFFVYVPWSWQNHWSYYIIYISGVCAGCTVTICKMSCDLLLTAFTMQTAIHFKALALNILAKYETVEFIKDEAFLKQIAHQHQKLFALVADLNNMFGIPMFVNVVGSCIEICLSAFEIMYSNSLLERCKYFIAFSAVGFQLYVICIFSEMLSAASTSVAQAIYEVHCKHHNKQVKNFMLFIGLRAEKPALIHATKYITLDCRTLATVLQISYKFYCLLSNVYHK